MQQQLSWRWNKSKPKTKSLGFSPMSSDQFEELRAILREAEKHGLEFIWIDCEYCWLEAYLLNAQ